MKEYLVCIDSDGCAIDSMECKHRLCFGPYIIDVWHLEQWKDAVLNRWNEINLYSMTRGINRFLGLEMILSEVDTAYCKIDGLAAYSRWCKKTATFSNAAIQTEIDKGTHPIFEMVLDWSHRVNAGIETIADQIKPFDGVAEALALIWEKADIAIVSSANPQAVQDEWTRFGLIDKVTYVMAQDAGTKADCIAKLLQQGYERNHVIMIGDAPGDQQAAEKNGVFYFPILAGKERCSWEYLMREGYNEFCFGEYGGAFQTAQVEQFCTNLSLSKQ